MFHILLVSSSRYSHYNHALFSCQELVRSRLIYKRKTLSSFHLRVTFYTFAAITAISIIMNIKFKITPIIPVIIPTVINLLNLPISVFSALLRAITAVTIAPIPATIYTPYAKKEGRG